MFFARLCLHFRDVTQRDCLVLNVWGRSCFHNKSLPSQPLFVTCQHLLEGQCVYISISVIAWAVHFQFDSNVWYRLNKLLKTWCCFVLHVVNTCTTIRSGRLCYTWSICMTCACNLANIVFTCTCFVHKRNKLDHLTNTTFIRKQTPEILSNIVS